jgi:uncharacterized protein YjbJ (UPF0337 family)
VSGRKLVEATRQKTIGEFRGEIGGRNDSRDGAVLKGQATFTVQGERKMDWNRVEGNWKQMKGKIKEKWGNLTDDDLTSINGKRDQLEGKIQERYGLQKDKVRKDVDDWYNSQTW